MIRAVVVSLVALSLPACGGAIDEPTLDLGGDGADAGASASATDACALPEGRFATPGSAEGARKLLVGRWRLCSSTSSPYVFGVDFLPNGQAYPVRGATEESMARDVGNGTRFDVEATPNGTYELVFVPSRTSNVLEGRSRLEVMMAPLRIVATRLDQKWGTVRVRYARIPDP